MKATRRRGARALSDGHGGTAHEGLRRRRGDGRAVDRSRARFAERAASSLAQIHEDQRRFDKVAAVLRPVVARLAAQSEPPREVLTLMAHLGFAELQIGDADAAIATFEKARALGGGSSFDLSLIQAYLLARNYQARRGPRAAGAPAPADRRAAGRARGAGAGQGRPRRSRRRADARSGRRAWRRRAGAPDAGRSAAGCLARRRGRPGAARPRRRSFPPT